MRGFYPTRVSCRVNFWTDFNDKDMDRKLTEKEVAFLSELSSLMLKHNAILSVEHDCVCIDVEYDADDEREPILLPHVTCFCDLEDMVSDNL